MVSLPALERRLGGSWAVHRVWRAVWVGGRCGEQRQQRQRAADGLCVARACGKSRWRMLGGMLALDAAEPGCLGLGARLGAVDGGSRGLVVSWSSGQCVAPPT